MRMSNTATPNLVPLDEENARRLAHFNATNEIYYKGKVFSPNFETVKHTIIRKRHHIGNGVYQPFYAIRGVRKSDSVQIFECDIDCIHWADGTTSIYWNRKNGNRFVMDNVKLPA